MSNPAMREIHGIANVRKYGGMANATQDITVTDHGDQILVGLSGCTYRAGLTAEEAEWLGRQLLAAARRLRGEPERPAPGTVDGRISGAGGSARAAKLSPERRREIASAAAHARWAK